MAAEVSVIVPNFNKAPFLGPALRSIMNQTHEEFEVIVIDDASTDDSVQVVESIARKDSRIRLIQKYHNQGVSAACNNGIRASKSTLITFLGSDDLFAPERLEDLLRGFQTTAHPQIVYSDPLLIGEDATTLTSRILEKTHRPEGYILDALITGLPSFYPSLITLPKECFEKVGLFDESLPWGEDFEMCLRLASQFPFAYCSRASYGYRIYAGNTANRISRKQRYSYQARILEAHYALHEQQFGMTTRSKAMRRLFSFYIGSREWRSVLSLGFHSRAGIKILAQLSLHALKRSSHRMPEETV